MNTSATLTIKYTYVKQVIIVSLFAYIYTHPIGRLQ